MIGSAAATPLIPRNSSTSDSGRPLSAAPVTSNAALPYRFSDIVATDFVNEL